MKKCLSLLEVVIALGLAAILLTTLFSSYRHLVLSKAEIEKARNTLYPQLFTQARLTQVFDGLKEPKSFYTEKETLLFTIDNGLDRDPNFCDKLSGTLSLEKDRVTLTLIGKEGGERSEVLQQSVHNPSFSFFDLEKKAWQPHWKKSDHFPAQVRLILNDEPMTFLIPATDHLVRCE